MDNNLMGVQTGTTDLSICLPNKEVGRLPIKGIETGVGSGWFHLNPLQHTKKCFFVTPDFVGQMPGCLGRQNILEYHIYCTGMKPYFML